MPLAIIPATFFLLAIFLWQKKKFTLPEIFVYSSVTLAGVMTLCTELFSLFASLSFNWIAAWWIVLVLLLLTLVGAELKSADPFVSLLRVHCVKNFAVDEKAYLLFIGLLLAVSGVVAWIAPPNTFDSMTYNMSRVMHWAQNKTVDFYPTTILRQLLSAPWSEYAILQTLILSGSDRFANFIQWICMLGSVGLVTCVAKELGANRRGQIFAALFCVTLPMGILQSTSTQNDYVVAFWLLCFVYQALKFHRLPKVVDGVVLGLALGLAVLTKPTAYLFAAPFVCLLIWHTARQAQLKPVLLLLGCLSLSLLVNVGHFYRNYEFSGVPLGQTLETGDYSYENAAFGPRVTASNLLRNVGLHLESRSRFDRIFQRSIEYAHEVLGVSIKDSKTTWPEYEFRVQGLKHHEDYAGNLWHVLFLQAAMVVYLLCLHKNRLTTGYVVSLIVAFCIFCTLLRWQPWHSRLHLPLFILWAPVVGVVIGQMQWVRMADIMSIRLPFLTKKFPSIGRMLVIIQNVKISYFVGLALIAWSLPSVFLSETKPLIGNANIFITPRANQVFYASPHMANAYIEAADLINRENCLKVALFGFGNDWEYPFWVLVRPQSGERVEVRHIAASTVTPRGTPLTSSDANKSFKPCAVVAPAYVSQEILRWNGREYHQTFSSGSIKIFQ